MVGTEEDSRTGEVERVVKTTYTVDPDFVRDGEHRQLTEYHDTTGGSRTWETAFRTTGADRLHETADGASWDWTPPLRITALPSVDRLPEITAPTLLRGGRHDVFATPFQAARIARHDPNTTSMVLEEGGHLPWVEEPTPSSPPSTPGWTSTAFERPSAQLHRLHVDDPLAPVARRRPCRQGRGDHDLDVLWSGPLLGRRAGGRAPATALGRLVRHADPFPSLLIRLRAWRSPRAPRPRAGGAGRRPARRPSRSRYPARRSP